MAVPELYRRAVDGLRAGAPAEHLMRLAWWMVGVAVVGAVFRTASRVSILNGARDVELSLRAQLYGHLTQHGPDFFNRFPTGDLMSRATNDLTQVRLMLGPGLLNVINAIVRYGLGITLMARIDWRLTCLSFVVYPPAVLLMRRLGRALFARNRAQQASLGALSSVIQENLAASALVRAYAIEPEQIRKFGEHNASYLARNLDLSWLRSGMFRVASSVSSLGMLLVALFGANQVLGGRLSLGAVVAMMEYMALLSEPTFAMGWILNLWQRGLSSLARLEEVMAAPVEVQGGEGTLPRGPLDLEVEGLAVDHGDGRGLTNLNFKLAAGGTLGIVGTIGSGKSTLVRALLRLTPHQGTVRLGGIDSRALSLDALREAFAYVPQNPTLLSKSLFDNVAFGAKAATGRTASAGAPPVDQAQVRAALRAAAMEAEALALPQGLDTPIGERGVTLSGGQKQRCAIARALLRDAPILLLDDALSAVDTQTEAKILEALRKAQRGRTTILVTHRVSTVAHADSILVLHQGQVVQQGTHDELLAQGGRYAEMVDKQKHGGDAADAPHASHGEGTRASLQGAAGTGHKERP